MNCPSCQHENRPMARFCARCGTKLQRLCPDCGLEVAPDDRFCDSCGANLAAPPAAPVAAGADPVPVPIPVAAVKPPSLEEGFATLQQAMPTAFREQILTEMEGENRVVTVLFADMSRSVETTAHLPPDEAADLVNRLLRAMVDALLKYGGRVDRFLGDGVLAVFGAPRAHESDPERAILAAQEIRQAATELGLEVTAGINTGEVYVGGVGSERHHEVTVMGPVVNLASRLQGQAEPGQILVGEATCRQARGSFEFAPLTLSLKGIAEPVRAYQVLRPLLHPEKARGIEGLRARLIGRQRELAALIEAADSLVSERKGQIATIVGEAGIGKTRLVQELKAYLKEQDIPWLEGRCISIGQSVSFWPFIDMMRTYLGISGEDTEKEIADRLVRKLTDLFHEDAEGIIPYVGQMLSVRLEERYQERIRHAAPEQIRRQTLLRMRDLFVALARTQPLGIILEDLHWADDLSLDLLWVLLDELVAAPLLLVCVYRPEREHGCWEIDGTASRKHLERYTRLPLEPLTQPESQQMVESLLTIRDLPAATKAVILENTEGNPFYVEELVRLLIERGVIYHEDGHWKAREMIGELVVPDTVRSVILSRIDRLHEEVKRVLQCASVIGRVFQRRLLEYLSGQNEALEAHLVQLEAYELVYKERSVPELEYAFKHALTQETAYEGILSRHRKVFHERVGAAIEALYQEQIEEYYELLALHYSRSENRNKAIEYLVKAAQKATARYANQEALRYYEGALTLAEVGAPLVGAQGGHQARPYDAILVRRAKVLLDMYRGTEAAGDYDRLLQSARQRGNREQELEAVLGLAAAHYTIALDGEGADAFSRSRELYESAYALAQALEDRERMVRALVATPLFIDVWPEYKDQAAAYVKEAMVLSRQIGDEGLILDSQYAWFAYFEGAEIEAQESELLARLTARHDLARLKEFYYRFMWRHLFRGNFERTVECCDAGIRLAHEMGVPPVQYPTLKALALLSLGCYGEAYAALQEEVADPEHRLGAAMKQLGAGIYFLELMAYDRAAEAARDVIEQARLLKRVWMEHWGYIVLARALVRSGQLDGATLGTITQELEAINESLPAEVMTEIYLSEGKLEAALAQAEEALSQTRELRWKPSTINTLELRLRILLQLDRPAEAIRVADEALPMAEELGYRPLVWRIRAGRARALGMLGEAEAAAQEYGVAASVLRALADGIDEPGQRQGFLADSAAASVLAAADQSQGPGTHEASNSE